MHHQLKPHDSFTYHKSTKVQAELEMVLELISITLPRSWVWTHVLAIELPQVSMYIIKAHETKTVLMSHLQIYYEKLILKHAWLNL